MCDLHSKFEEDRTKTTVAIVTNGIADKQTDRQTDRHSSDFISVQCRALYWTDKKCNEKYTC